MSSKGVQKLGYFHRGKSVVLIKQLTTFHRFFWEKYRLDRYKRKKKHFKTTKTEVKKVEHFERFFQRG